jgi:hypothetical protein
LMAYSRDIVLKGQLPPISSLILWLVIHTAMVLLILRIFIKLEPRLVERA